MNKEPKLIKSDSSQRRLQPTDLTERYSAIECFRDIFNFWDMLDYEKELAKLRASLFNVGWGKKFVEEMQIIGGTGTRFEKMIPHRIKEMGDHRAWRDLKFRSN